LSSAIAFTKTVLLPRAARLSAAYAELYNVNSPAAKKSANAGIKAGKTGQTAAFPLYFLI